ncbi:TetR/AcrR family transcriptional regulator [Amycolatopsis sp. lyj-108]|uniref:TetR/AcrR family transcriptional regulator n=1 Tax=Amycolatopsis sp. lyj-108 TaxID=2789286 RepID=UPI00397DC216
MVTHDRSNDADGRRLRGERSRAVALAAVVDLASSDGLSGVSMAQLAARLGVSKSGLFTHWSDKEQLQLAAIDHARDQWAELVVHPALTATSPLLKLWRLHELRLDFYDRGVLRGGCFFVMVEREFRDHPGAVRDRIRELAGQWEAWLCSLITDAVAAGELREGIVPEQLAFEIDAVGAAVVTRSGILDRDSIFAHGRAAILQRLRALCPDPRLLPDE